MLKEGGSVPVRIGEESRREDMRMDDVLSVIVGEDMLSAQAIGADALIEDSF